MTENVLGNPDRPNKICEEHGSAFVASLPEEKLGVALSTIGQSPINGLRHPKQGNTCGWYIWCGENMDKDPAFFDTLHISHISEPPSEDYEKSGVFGRALCSCCGFPESGIQVPCRAPAHRRLSSCPLGCLLRSSGLGRA